MSETETTSSDEAPQSTPESAPPPAPEAAPAPVQRFDFSDLRGFQSVGAAAHDDPEAYAAELAKELVVRAERFANSVDDSIVLASDGVIRWLGDPVGRLVPGDEVLAPRAVLLADDALPTDARETVERRLGLWVTAHVRKVLGPLETLAAAEGLADSAREVASKVAEALGVLDRERVRAQVKSLDQNARAALRKLGVRFGAHYVFVPALLKPGARTLCSQLQALKHEVEAGADRLLAYAAAGRTSFAAEGELSPESYRLAGFRLCGERVVRVDIVERLTDLIRAAIPDQMRPGASPTSEAAGFLVSQQMTSLTGCAGDAFASILRSLGYESHQVKKAEFEAAMRKPEPAATKPAAPVAEPAETAAASDAEASAPDGDAHDGDSLETEAHEAEAAELAAAETAPDTTADEAAGEEAPVAEIAEAPVAEEPALDAEPPVATVEEASEASAEPEAEGAPEAEAAPVVEEFVEVWRPAPRPRRQHHHHGRHHHPKGRHGSGEGTGRIVWRAKEPVSPPPSPPPQETPAPAAAEGAAPDARREEPSRGRHGDRRPPPQKGPRRDDRRPDFQAKAQADSGQRRDQRAKPVDPDSPFAKLLALKPLLEQQDKRK